MLKGKKAEKVEKYKEHFFYHEVPQSTRSNAHNSSYSFGRDLDLLTFFEQDSALFSFKEKERVCSFYSCHGQPSYNSSRKYWIFPAEKAQQSPFERCYSYKVLKLSSVKAIKTDQNASLEFSSQIRGQ